MKNIFLICFLTSIVLIGIEAFATPLTTASTPSRTALKDLTAGHKVYSGISADESVTFPADRDLYLTAADANLAPVSRPSFVIQFPFSYLSFPRKRESIKELIPFWIPAYAGMTRNAIAPMPRMILGKGEFF